MTNRILTPSLNGHVDTAPRKGRKAKGTAEQPAPQAKKPRKPAKGKGGLDARRKMALAVGGVGIAVLALSIAHCSEAIAALTGSNMVLAALLALGIDCGMVACELAAIVGKDRVPCRRWAMAYIAMAVGLSCLLNAWASGHAAADGLQVAAYAVGGVIPLLVLVLGKVAGLLWE